jgi:hypothetical protein
LEFRFQTGHFRKHDPKVLVLKHTSQVSSYWPYAHDRFEDEVFKENAYDWDEVVARMVDPWMTRFKAMSLDEQVVALEKLAQEVLRAREEMVSVETTETSLVAPIQEINFLEAQGARERGLLMYEQDQWIIDQMEGNPNLIKMLVLLVNDQDES